MSISNGIKAEYTYTANNQLELLKNWSGTTLLDSYLYAYDAAGNQTYKIEMEGGVTRGTTHYEYDKLNRLSKVQEPDGKVTLYSYDAAGNRVQEKIVKNGVTTYLYYFYNEQNRLVEQRELLANGEETKDQYRYDNNGNLIYKGREISKLVDFLYPVSPSFGMFIEGQSNESADIADIANQTENYRYDGWNQLIGYSSGRASATYAYNGEGYRTEKTVNGQKTHYLYEADKVILELDGSAQVSARNVYGNHLLIRRVDGASYRVLYNGHGDVTSLLDEQSVVKASYRYDAFGNILETIGNVNNNIRYAGYQYDEESGLYYLNARHYDPAIARFMSEDTYEGELNNPLSLNLYTYVLNNPLIYVDPTGHWCESKDGNWAHPGRCTSKDSEESPDFANDGNSIISNGNEIGTFYYDPTNDSVSQDLIGDIVFDSVITGGAGLTRTILVKGSKGIGGLFKPKITKTEPKPITIAHFKTAENLLAESVGAASKTEIQVTMRTSLGIRYVDVLKDGVAYESKLGKVNMSPSIRKQIMKDGELLKTGQVDSVEWHFFESPYTGIGPSDSVRELLESYGIKIIIETVYK